MLGEEHPDSLRSIANLALMYKKQGQWKKAKQPMVLVVEMRWLVLGEEHPDSLMSIVMSSASYSIFRSWKLEVGRFPGIGFSLCAVPTFNRVQGILNRGFESSFQNVLEWRECTGMILSTSVGEREMEG